MKIEVPSVAKINRFIKIIGKSEMGYHQLFTYFQFIDFADKITFDFHNKIFTEQEVNNFLNGVKESRFPERDVYNILVTLTSNNPTLQANLHNNLMFRAVSILIGKLIDSPEYLKDAKIRKVEIYLEKRIPIGAGLGGGSSNAATVLIMLNHVWNLKIPVKVLCELGNHLGSDVPIFIYGKSSYATGYGDVIIDYQEYGLPDLSNSNQEVELFLTGLEVMTENIFLHPHIFDSYVVQEAASLDDSLQYIKEYGVESVKELNNDLTDILKLRSNYFAAIEHYTGFAMSGSGSTLFKLINSEQDLLTSVEKRHLADFYNISKASEDLIQKQQFLVTKFIDENPLVKYSIN